MRRQILFNEELCNPGCLDPCAGWLRLRRAHYAGNPGCTYDAALNPPQARGVVTYDALKPVVPYDYGNGGDAAATR